VASYLFIGGVAGASQVVATIAELCDSEQSKDVVRAGRYLAIAGAVAGPLFLIADLHTPERWYNMLRIFRRTSSMSIGSWTLMIFGTTSALTALGQFLADERGGHYDCAARIFALPAAASGAVVATYTGTLLGATSTPLWAAASRFLPALFGASAMATSTAALTCAVQRNGIRSPGLRTLERLGLIAAAAELGLSSAMERHLNQEKLASPLEHEPIAAAYRVGYKGLGLIAPLALKSWTMLSRRRSCRWSLAAAAATLLGGYIMRSAILAAGRKSARNPQEYFRYTRA
jgi:formate-dependent nitrite reductase membrane component NrfD